MNASDCVTYSTPYLSMHVLRFFSAVTGDSYCPPFIFRLVAVACSRLHQFAGCPFATFVLLHFSAKFSGAYRPLKCECLVLVIFAALFQFSQPYFSSLVRLDLAVSPRARPNARSTAPGLFQRLSALSFRCRSRIFRAEFEIPGIHVPDILADERPAAFPAPDHVIVPAGYPVQYPVNSMLS